MAFGRSAARRCSDYPATGGGDGHLLPVRARSACTCPAGPTTARCRCSKCRARAPCASSRAHRIPARHPVARRARRMERAPHRPAGRRRCCARCRRPTASWCWNTRVATSRPENWSDTVDGRTRVAGRRSAQGRGGAGRDPRPAFFYGANRIFRGLNLTIQRGKMVAISAQAARASPRCCG